MRGTRFWHLSHYLLIYFHLLASQLLPFIIKTWSFTNRLFHWLQKQFKTVVVSFLSSILNTFLFAEVFSEGSTTQGIAKTNSTETFGNFQGNKWCGYLMHFFWNFTKIYSSKDLTFQVKCIKKILQWKHQLEQHWWQFYQLWKFFCLPS